MYLCIGVIKTEGTEDIGNGFCMSGFCIMKSNFSASLTGRHDGKEVRENSAADRLASTEIQMNVSNGMLE